MEEMIDPVTGVIVAEWSDEELDHMYEEADQMRDELRRVVDSFDREMLRDVELTTDGFEMTIAMFEVDQEEYLVYWRVGCNGGYEVFSSDKGSVYQSEQLSDVASFVNREL